MSDRARKLLQDALGLSVSERAGLAADLLASLDGDPDDEVEQAWASELERRARAALADPEGGEPWETVRDGLRAELRKE
jgi:putative addiction module component (TIGR02574 family)